MKPKIHSVGIYWQNDRPGGLGIVIMDEDDLSDPVQRVIQLNEDAWDKEADKESLVQLMFAQLAQLADGSDEQRRKFWVIAFGNIYLLVKHGYMPNDEYNGIAYMKEFTGHKV
jgi:hypothetical protein